MTPRKAGSIWNEMESNMGSGSNLTITDAKLKAMIDAEIAKAKDELLEVIKIATNDQMIDITAPSDVEVKIRSDGKVVWVNVDGICKFRACQIGKLELVDERKEVKDAAKI